MPRQKRGEATIVDRLTHEATETLKGSGNANVGVDFDKDASCGVDVDLQQARLVQGRVEQREEALKKF